MREDQMPFAVVTSTEPPHLFQRVVRVLGEDGDAARIRFGAHIIDLSKQCLRPIPKVSHEVGDRVSCNRGLATIRDAIWHFNDDEPNYYLEIGGKNESRRYLSGDLTPISQ
jgi:hypothetical protein